jgi:hypothetical protein
MMLALLLYSRKFPLENEQKLVESNRCFLASTLDALQLTALGERVLLEPKMLARGYLNQAPHSPST